MYRPTYIDSSAPTVNDDYSAGFRQGNFWFDDSTNSFYVLKDHTTGAASWVLVSGGAATAWANYVPTFSWTGGSPTMTYVARYRTQGNTVIFQLWFEAANTSGSTATKVDITLPVTPKDNNNYLPIHAMYCQSAMTSLSDVYGTMLFGIDGNDNTGSNRKLYCLPSFSLLNGSTWTWFMEGFYEIA